MTHAIGPLISMLLAWADTDQLQRYHQPEQCGPIALYAVCRVCEVNSTLEELRNLAGTHRGGTTVAGLVKAAQSKGLRARPYNSSLRHLRSVDGPAIIDFPRGHFCVLMGWQKDSAIVFDPPEAPRLVTTTDLEAEWGSHVIVFSKPGD